MVEKTTFFMVDRKQREKEEGAGTKHTLQSYTPSVTYFF
jgi:hypothetical protein